MFNKGDFIIYGGTGVCKVVDITSPGFAGISKDKLYYVLDPLYQDGTVYSPVDNVRVIMRPVLSKEDAEKLIDMIPEICGKAYYNSSIQQLTQHYKDFLKTYDCEDLIELTMSIYSKKNEVENNQRSLGQIDKKYMKQAEDILFGELAVSLGIARDEVPDYIKSRIEN